MSKKIFFEKNIVLIDYDYTYFGIHLYIYKKNWKLMTDEQILESIRDNVELSECRLALKQVYKNNFPMVEHLVLSNSGSKDDAKDIFQDTMVAFYNTVKTTDFRLSGKISTYLFAVAKNLWLRKIRDNKVMAHSNETTLTNIPIDGSSLSNLVYTEEQEILGDMLHEAGSKCVKLLKLFYYEKMKMIKISEHFGFASEQVAKNQKVRCLKKLKAIMLQNQYYRENLENAY